MSCGCVVVGQAKGADCRAGLGTIPGYRGEEFQGTAAYPKELKPVTTADHADAPFCTFLIFEMDRRLHYYFRMNPSSGRGNYLVSFFQPSLAIIKRKQEIFPPSFPFPYKIHKSLNIEYHTPFSLTYNKHDRYQTWFFFSSGEEGVQRGNPGGSDIIEQCYLARFSLFIINNAIHEALNTTTLALPDVDLTENATNTSVCFHE